MTLELGINPDQKVSEDMDTTTGAETMADTKELNPKTAALSTKKGSTRGKNPRAIEYEAFDREKVETLPKDIATFMAVTKVTEESDLVNLLIDGYNDSQYSAASDEIGEFINDEWNKEYQAQFRLTIRNFSKMSGKSIEDTVSMLKTAIDAGWEAKKVELAAAKLKAEEDAKKAASEKAA